MDHWPETERQVAASHCDQRLTPINDFPHLLYEEIRTLGTQVLILHEVF